MRIQAAIARPGLGTILRSSAHRRHQQRRAAEQSGVGWDGMIIRRSLLHTHDTNISPYGAIPPGLVSERRRRQRSSPLVHSALLFCSGEHRCQTQTQGRMNVPATRQKGRPDGTISKEHGRHNFRRMTHRLANPRGPARPAPPSTSRVVVADALLCLLCLVRAGPLLQASRQWHSPRP